MEDIVKKIKNPRVRIAPSPTGPLHIGTVRTALFNYLFAKKYDGVFVLRIEDTDTERSKIEWEENILENLNWLGLHWDEGIDINNRKKYLGDYGPYRQSERKQIYEKYINKLLEQGQAYRCFCSKEELEAQRQYQLSIGEAPHYTGTCRNLSPETIRQNIESGKPSIIRLKTPVKKIFFDDLIKGRIEFDTSLLGDIAIAKDTSSPLYNLAVVIDDYEMKIDYVMRGEDHIPNTPKQILLQEILGFPRPNYAHFPLILGPDKSKLSKRHGAVSVGKYREEGYLPESLINLMALLGWNPGTEKEIYSLNSLVKEFSLKKCHKSSAVFNIQKLDWINGFYIRQKSKKKITELCLPYLLERGLIKEIVSESENGEHLASIGPIEPKKTYLIIDSKEKISSEKIEEIISLYQERLKKLSEIVELSSFFFKNKLEYPKELLKWKDMNDNDIKTALEGAKTAILGVSDDNWSKDTLTDILLQKTQEIGPKGDRGFLLWPLRVALSGQKKSAPPFDIAVILGKEKTLERINQAEDKLK